MKLVKCPRCGLNYTSPEEKYCDICKKELQKQQDNVTEEMICPECGENIVMKGKELCKACYIEQLKLEAAENAIDKNNDEEDEEILDPDLDEIEDEDVPEDELEKIEEEFADDLEEDLDE